MAYPIMNLIYGLPLTAEVSQKIDEWEVYQYDSSELIGKFSDPEDLWYEDQITVDGRRYDSMCGFITVYNGESLQHEGWCGVLLDTVSAIGSFKAPDRKATEKQKKEALVKIAELHPKLKELAGGDENIGYHVVMGTS